MSTPSPGLKIATLRGVPIYIGRTWPLIALVIVALFGPQVADLHPEWGFGAYLLAAAYAVTLLFSVLVHEAAHALTAQACGYAVSRIVADLMGGHTAYDSGDATPGRSALVAAVGPLSNAVLAVAGWFALDQLPGDGAAHLLVAAFTWSNGFVAAFNLLPGLPLDGGFLVDALVWKVTGIRAKGLKAAGWCGRAVAVGIVAWAVLPFLSGHGGGWDLVWRLFIASFLWRGASAAVTVGTNQEFLGGIPASAVVTHVLTAPADTPVADLPESAAPLVLTDAGRAVAVVPPGTHVRVPIEQRAHVPASALSEALAPDATVDIADLDDDVMTVLPAFEGDPTPGIAVVTQHGAIVGVVLLQDLQRVIEQHARTRSARAGG